jgi:hypothetical protein
MMRRPGIPALFAGTWAALAAVGAAGSGSFSNVDVAFKGAGWLKSGMIMESSDTLTGNGANKYEGNWMQDAGVLFTGVASLDGDFEAAFGLGAIQRHPLQGRLNQAKDVRLGLNVFSTQGRISWFPGGKRDYRTKFDFGLFPYKYDANIKNLGLYLIRGAVYPGLLVSGFEAKEMLNTANMLGARMEHKRGSFTQDVVLTSETDLKPYYDFSILYVTAWKPARALELGAGINCYHCLPVRPGATSPSGKDGFDPASRDETAKQPHPFDYIYAVPVDSAVIPRAGLPDSIAYTYTWASHQGVKLMFRFAFDPRALFPDDSPLGKNDLRLYGEAAVIGVKDYPGIYDDIRERIPVMLGFNLPAFRLLDVLALEVEWYGSRLVPDYRKVTQVSAVPQSPWINRTPAVPGASATGLNRPYDVKGDDWKWSLYASKVLAGHVRMSGQVANDHFRTGGTPGAPGRSFEEGLTAPGDWYWNVKLSYFF